VVESRYIGTATLSTPLVSLIGTSFALSPVAFENVTSTLAVPIRPVTSRESVVRGTASDWEKEVISNGTVVVVVGGTVVVVDGGVFPA
jgi:hypothetical protein